VVQLKAPPFDRRVVGSTGTKRLSEARRREGASVVFGQIELVGGGEKAAQVELPVEVGAPDLPVTQGLFEMQRPFPGLRGLAELMQIGDLGRGKGR
jgi:hypothetical protein